MAEPREALNLSELEEGQPLELKMGEGPEAYLHRCIVIKPGLKPICSIEIIEPDGTQLPGSAAQLEGHTEKPDVNFMNPGENLKLGEIATGGHVSVFWMHIGRSIVQQACTEIKVLDPET